MRRLALRLWLCTGVLTCTVVAGCAHGDRRYQAVHIKPAGSAAPVAPPSALLAQGPDAEGAKQGKTVSSPYRTQPPAPLNSSAAPERQRPAPPASPIGAASTGLQQSPPGSPVVMPLQEPRVLQTATPVAPKDAPVLLPVIYTKKQEPSSPRTGWVVLDRKEERPPVRRCFRDITAHPAFAHDRQHRWLVGILEKGATAESWSLRYASVEEDDPYSGRVTLVGSPSLADFHPGQLVRVEGEAANPGVHQWGAPYRVKSIALVTHP